MRSIVVIAHDIRSAHNVGSLLRTCEGLGVRQVYLTGYTPYPPLVADDRRLPHISTKLGKQIRKTALGAEQLIPWSHFDDVSECITELKRQGYRIVALEQTSQSLPLPDYEPPQQVALLLGREVEGIHPDLLAQCDEAVVIPMFGQKESFNVVQAAAMALYHCQFAPLA